MEVNRPGTAGVRDVLYGPKPAITSLELLGTAPTEPPGIRPYGR